MDNFENDGLKDVPYSGQPIYAQEGKMYEDKLRYLIGRHNTLCSVENAFNNNAEALKCFNEAKEEVLDNGNQSIGSMFYIAIEMMSDKIEEYEVDENETISNNLEKVEMRKRLMELEMENIVLKSKLEKIAALLGDNNREKLDCCNE